MKKASELVADVMKRQGNARRDDYLSPEPRLPEKWVKAIFAKLTVRYGGRWTAHIDSDELTRIALDEWSRRLANCTGVQIAYALDKWTGDFPPTVHQFAELCRAGAPTAAHKRLPRPQTDPAVVAQQIAKMREVLTQ